METRALVRGPGWRLRLRISRKLAREGAPRGTAGTRTRRPSFLSSALPPDEADAKVPAAVSTSPSPAVAAPDTGPAGLPRAGMFLLLGTTSSQGQCGGKPPAGDKGTSVRRMPPSAACPTARDNAVGFGPVTSGRRARGTPPPSSRP